jgi:hypothetical protein
MGDRYDDHARRHPNCRSGRPHRQTGGSDRTGSADRLRDRAELRAPRPARQPPKANALGSTGRDSAAGPCRCASLCVLSPPPRSSAVNALGKSIYRGGRGGTPRNPTPPRQTTNAVGSTGRDSAPGCSPRTIRGRSENKLPQRVAACRPRDLPDLRARAPAPHPRRFLPFLRSRALVWCAEVGPRPYPRDPEIRADPKLLLSVGPARAAVGGAGPSGCTAKRPSPKRKSGPPATR